MSQDDMKKIMIEIEKARENQMLIAQGLRQRLRQGRKRVFKGPTATFYALNKDRIQNKGGKDNNDVNLDEINTKLNELEERNKKLKEIKDKLDKLEKKTEGGKRLNKTSKKRSKKKRKTMKN